VLSKNWKRKIKYSNRGYAYVNEFVVLVEGHDMFRLGAVETGRKMNLSGICPSRYIYKPWLDGCLGLEPRGMGLLSMTGEDRPCPFYNYTLAFALQLRKAQKT
jgi:hypothetical protein